MSKFASHDRDASDAAVYDDDNDDCASDDDYDADDADGADVARDADIDIGVGGEGISLSYDVATGDIPGLPTRDDLVRRSDTTNLTPGISENIRNGKPVFFMPNDVHEDAEYVKGVPVYKLHLFGVLTNGSKAHVVVDNIKVYFDVRVPDKETDLVGFGQRLRHLLGEHRADPDLVEDVEGFPIQGYRTHPARWKRLSFPNLQVRKRAIELVRQNMYETASDDRSNYYSMAARVHGIVLTDWGVLKNYTYARGGAHPDGESPNAKSPRCSHVFRVKPDGFVPFVDPMAPKSKQEERLAKRQASPHLSRDKTLVMGWDIETYDSARTGALPLGDNPNTRVFMICATFHWKDDPEPLLRLCLTDVPAAADPRWVTVVCGSEQNLILAFAAVWRALAPDIAAGFNDSDYDWRFVCLKAAQYGILSVLAQAMSASARAITEEGALKWQFVRDRRVKISAGETTMASFLKTPGFVPLDVRTAFRQLYPKAEVGKGSSLAFYLRACNLEPKADMPIKRMWDIYAAALAARATSSPGDSAAKMRLVAYYCVVDAARCQELMVKRNVVSERREVAALSYVSFYDAVYRANGHKVCNMLAAYAHRRNLFCSSIPSDESVCGKYPGAWVFHPQKGLVPDPSIPAVAAFEAARAEYIAGGKVDATALLELYIDYVAKIGRPVTSLDFASLYPSLMMTYNFSPEKCVFDEAVAAQMRADGKQLHYVNFPFGGRTIRGWFVRHDGVEGEYGLYPSILIDLFNKRAGMKRLLGALERDKERMDVILGAAKDSALLGALAAAAPLTGRLGALAAVLTEDEAKAAFAKLYCEVSFEIAALDSKQKALKVYMNTFYGETGNSLSPFYLLQLAGGVTSAGQENIKMVADFVQAQGFTLMYGDTDSLYLVPPYAVYDAADRRYAFGESTREEYWAEMVEITMVEMAALRARVNDFLRANNGTEHLKMNYEEVLYPVVFTGKKKYFGIAHVNEPNFHPQELFIRGIDVVKQGQTDLAKKIGNKIMRAAVDPSNPYDMLTIVENVLRDAVLDGDQWSFEDFVRSDAWKPDKDNKAVQRFIARMRVRAAAEEAENARRAAAGEPPGKLLYTIPDPGERFRYVLTRPGAMFDLRGRKAVAKKGDVMEFADAARELRLPIDVALYLASYVVGLCARFINYDARFAPATPLDEKTADKKSQAAAKKYLETFIAGLQNTHPLTMQKRGYAYKRAWTHAACESAAELKTIGPASEVLHGDFLNWSLFLPEEEGADPVAPFAQAARDLANRASDADSLRDHAGRVLRAFGIAPDGSDAGDKTKTSGLYRALSAFVPPRRGRAWCSSLSGLDNAEGDIRRRMAEVVTGSASAAASYEAHLALVVESWRAREHAERPELGEYAGGAAQVAAPFSLDPGALACLEEVRALWLKLCGVYIARARYEAVASALVTLRDRRQAAAVDRPGRLEINAIVSEAAQRFAA